MLPMRSRTVRRNRNTSNNPSALDKMVGSGHESACQYEQIERTQRDERKGES